MIRQFSKNVFSSWMALGIRMLIVFLVNPFIIHTLGDSRYGAWALIFSIINYLTIFDMGMRQAVLKFISKYMGLKDYDNVNSIVNTSFVLYSIVALITVGISLLISLFILDLFNIPPDFLNDTRYALLIIGLNVAFNFLMMSWTESLNAVHRYDIANGLAIFEDVLRTITIIYLLSLGYGIIAMAGSFLLFSVIRQIIAYFWLRKIHPEIRPGFKFINRETISTLYKYGAIGFLISIAWLFIANTDNVIIGYFFDTSAVTKYAVAGSIMVYLRNMILAVSFPLRPIISQFDALDKKDSISYIYSRGTRYLAFISFVSAGILFVYAESFILLWLGPGYEQTARILQILAIPAAIYMPQTVANSVLYGLGEHKNILYAITFEGLANLGLSLILLKFYGIYGVAYGTIIPQVLIYSVVMPIIIRSVLGIGITGFYRSMLSAAVTGGGISSGGAYWANKFIPAVSWLELLAGVIVTLGICLLAVRLIIDKKDWQYIKNSLFSRS